MKHAITWFEIPVANLDRAVKFYANVLEIELKAEVFEKMNMALFPYECPGVGGALVLDPRRAPSAEGTLVYIDAAGKLDVSIGRVKAAGGEVVLPRTDIGAPGFIAIMRDTEGNLVGLHAPTGEPSK